MEGVVLPELRTDGMPRRSTFESYAERSFVLHWC